jgi:hypothetical protein
MLVSRSKRKDEDRGRWLLSLTALAVKLGPSPPSRPKADSPFFQLNPRSSATRRQK